MHNPVGFAPYLSALTLFLPVLLWLVELLLWLSQPESHSAANLRSCIPHSDRTGCTGKWRWVACPLSSADAKPSAWRSEVDSSDRRNGKVAWGQCWRTPMAQSVMPGCSAPHIWPGAPSGEIRGGDYSVQVFKSQVSTSSFEGSNTPVLFLLGQTSGCNSESIGKPKIWI